LVAGLPLLEGFTRRVNRLFTRLAGIIVLAITLVVLCEIFLRYALNAPTTWAMDGARFAVVYVFFLALGPALESGHHVVVDLFDRLLPLRLRPYQRVLGDLLTLIFAALLLWYLLQETRQVFASGETAFSVVAMPLKYIYWIGPVGALEFLLTALALLGRSWRSR
jgi:TRAP-type C4-dicarboxylate transport system permease small subunit